MKTTIRILFIGSLFITAGCTLQQLEEKLKEVQPTVDTVAATGVTGPWGLGASLVVNGLLGILSLRQKRGLTAVKGAFGVVSRALDTATKGEAGDLVAPEIASTPGVTTDLLKSLHADARDKEI
jgi:hypothetical protein